MIRTRCFGVWKFERTTNDTLSGTRNKAKGMPQSPTAVPPKSRSKSSGTPTISRETKHPSHGGNQDDLERGKHHSTRGTTTRWQYYARSMALLLEISNNVVKVHPWLATVHGRHIIHEVGLLTHAPRAQRTHRHFTTPSAHLRVIKVSYIVPAWIHLKNSRVQQRKRCASVERGDITLILP